MNLAEIARRFGFAPTGILHVGASACNEAEVYQQMGIRTVIWIEALPPLKHRQDRAKYFGHTLYESTPFSDRQESIKLQVASNAVSSSILPFHRHSVLYPDIVVKEEIPTKTIRADKFFDGHAFPPEINTLVIDAQGADLRVIKGMGGLLDRMDVVVCEVFLTELYSGSDLKPEIERHMATAGFRMVEFEEVHKGEWGNCLFLRHPMADAIANALQVDGMITEEELRILRGLCTRTNARVIVETGTYKGRTATLFAGLGATVFTIDDYSGRWARPDSPPGLGDFAPDQMQEGAAMEAVKGNPRIFPITLNTYTGIERIKDAFALILGNRKADLCFLDGNHSYEVVSRELVMAEQIVRPGGIICGHDLDFTPTVGKALREVRGENFETLSTKLWAYVK